MDINIRPYTEGDKQTIIAMLEDFQDYLVELDPLKRLRKMPGYGEVTLNKTIQETQANNGIFYVALQNEEIAGFTVALLLQQSLEDQMAAIPSLRGRITELYVAVSYRGQGIGTKLIKAAEKHLQEKGCDVIRIEVFVPNVNAHSLYKKLGYDDRDIDMIKIV